jgi:pimeloyl-ACP methyl ester carboxylesterase
MITMRLAALVLSVLIAGTTGCGMLHVKEQQAKIDAFCVIGGRVEAERKDAAPLVVVLARQTGADLTRRDSWQLADHFVLESAGEWRFHAAPGTYGIVAFQDLNGDLKAQPGEPYLRMERERLITCQTGEHKTDVALRIPAAGRSRMGNETIDVAALQARSVGEQFAVSLSQVTAVGAIASLSDPRFADEIANSGLWQPFDFLFKGGPGVYFLEPYDRKKIPVLFVHGINGSPTNFKTLIERLDRNRFQPWVYYYPGGASLPNVADHLAQTMRKLQVEHDFTRFAVVAHSMGGLVSRGFIQRYRAGGGAAIPVFISIATPFDGHKAAESGVKHAPAVVRVWYDMAPGSEYLQSIYTGEFGVPHHLLFTFRQGGGLFGAEANDGTVTVASQLRPAAQQNAARVEGFNETHMGVLESKEVSQRVNGLLEKLTP